MVKNCALVLTSYPARLMYEPKVIEAWTHSKEQPEKKVLYLSLTQYPNRDKDVPANILSDLKRLDVTIIYRKGDERNFKSYYAGEDFPNWWLLQIDDDWLAGEGSFDRFYALHKTFPNTIITCKDTPCIIGNGVFYQASMLDKRYLTDMYKVVPLLLSDLWLAFWASYAQINVTPMIPAQDRKFMPETNDTYLGQEYCSGNHIQQFQDLLIREYPKEYKIAKAFVGGNALWVKPKKKNIIYRAIRKIYREIRKRISL